MLKIISNSHFITFLQYRKSHLNIAAATAEGCKGTATVWFDTDRCWGAAGILPTGCRTDT